MNTKVSIQCFNFIYHCLNFLCMHFLLVPIGGSHKLTLVILFRQSQKSMLTLGDVKITNILAPAVLSLINLTILGKNECCCFCEKCDTQLGLVTRTCRKKDIRSKIYYLSLHQHLRQNLPVIEYNKCNYFRPI